MSISMNNLKTKYIYTYTHIPIYVPILTYTYVCIFSNVVLQKLPRHPLSLPMSEAM